MHDNMKNGKLRALLVGDAVGIPGRTMFQKYISELKKDYDIDIVIVNGENSASNGRGISSRIVHFFKHNGAHVITSGNHIWDNKEIYNYLSQNTDLLRPDNFPSECPGTGVMTFETKGFIIGVINLQGRVFMKEHVSCPFKAADSILTYLRSKTSIIFVDFHAETTSEKLGLAYYLDGRVTAVVGTHTHVQTADERILPQGTAYITDLGMAGSLNSMIGMKKDSIIRKLITQMPEKFVVDTEGPFVLSGVVIDVDPETGRSSAIQRIRIIDNDIKIDVTAE
jgi:2',3'-cyclic-nucleotide 2'-phosphodiesterase